MTTTTTRRDGAATGDAAGATSDNELAYDGKPRRTSGGKKRRGVCSECGAPASSRTATLCDDHALLRTDPRPRTTAAVVGRNLEHELRINLELAAQLWGMRDPVCGAAAMQSAPGIAAYWAERARESERTAAAIEKLVSSAGWLGAISVHGPLALAVFAHHIQPAIDARRRAAEGEPEPEHHVGATPWVPSAEGATTNGDDVPPVVDFDQLPANYPPPHVDYTQP